MTQHETTDAAAIWLHLLGQEGGCTIAEIADAMGLNRVSVRECIQKMPQSGSMRRHEPDAENPHIRYSVTLGCKVPAGVTLRDLARAGAIRLEAE